MCGVARHLFQPTCRAITLFNTPTSTSCSLFCPLSCSQVLSLSLSLSDPLYFSSSQHTIHSTLLSSSISCLYHHIYTMTSISPVCLPSSISRPLSLYLPLYISLTLCLSSSPFLVPSPSLNSNTVYRYGVPHVPQNHGLLLLCCITSLNKIELDKSFSVTFTI